MANHVTEVAEGVHRLTHGVANFYLIQKSGKLVLVDAGAPKDWALFTLAARTLGKASGDLDAVLLTHAHTHHTGFAEQARATIGARCGSTSTTCRRRAPGWSGRGTASKVRTCSAARSGVRRSRVGPQIMPSGLNADTQQALASLSNLTGIEADVLLPGHGGPWTGGVEEAIRQARVAGSS